MKVHLVLFISTADPVKGPQLRDIDLFTCPPQGLTLSLGREVACELMQDECASFQEGFEHIAQNLVQFPMLYQWMYQLLTGSLFDTFRAGARCFGDS